MDDTLPPSRMDEMHREPALPHTAHLYRRYTYVIMTKLVKKNLILNDSKAVTATNVAEM